MTAKKYLKRIEDLLSVYEMVAILEQKGGRDGSKN